MLQGIARYERSHQQWSAFLDDETRSETDPQWLRSAKWDGVISRTTTPELIENCTKLGIPLVDLNDCPPFPGVPKIRPDNVAIGHLGAEHFLERGFRHFAFTGLGNESWSRERRDGFVEALRLAGFGCEVHDAHWPGDLTPFWDARQTKALASWIKKMPSPAAIMACNDMRGLQVMSAAQVAERIVPEEIAVLGANNDANRCDLAYPPLSSVAGNPFQNGYRAAEFLDRLMRGHPPETMDERVEPVSVVVRHSTDVLAISDRNVAAALSIIRMRACEGIRVDELLQDAASSRSQLEKKFRRFLGRSPQAEIRRVQMEKVKQLLIETDFPLKKVAELTGFEHVEYMCVVFKRLTGESPGRFRKGSQRAGV